MPRGRPVLRPSLGLTLDAPSTRRLHAESVRACYLRWAATGRDLTAYNTTENAADFADLRTALGITEWNVFGASYGSNLGLTLMREHPEGIRSVILVSVQPPSVVYCPPSGPIAAGQYSRESSVH